MLNQSGINRTLSKVCSCGCTCVWVFTSKRITFSFNLCHVILQMNKHRNYMIYTKHNLESETTRDVNIYSPLRWFILLFFIILLSTSQFLIHPPPPPTTTTHNNHPQLPTTLLEIKFHTRNWLKWCQSLNQTYSSNLVMCLSMARDQQLPPGWLKINNHLGLCEADHTML